MKPCPIIQKSVKRKEKINGALERPYYVHEVLGNGVYKL
jgi:hypothetical protein